jgi:hypothetical protein
MSREMPSVITFLNVPVIPCSSGIIFIRGMDTGSILDTIVNKAIFRKMMFLIMQKWFTLYIRGIYER